MINGAVIVSGGQQNDAVISGWPESLSGCFHKILWKNLNELLPAQYLCMCLLVSRFFSQLGYITLSRVPCAIRGPRWLCFKYSGCTCPSPYFVTINSFSKSVSLFLFCK